MRKPINGAYYRLKAGHGTLCFRVLKMNHVSSKGYFKVKCDWWTEASGSSWGNQFGLPRNWKITFENFENFEQFRPEWARPYA